MQRPMSELSDQCQKVMHIMVPFEMMLHDKHLLLGHLKRSKYILINYLLVVNFYIYLLVIKLTQSGVKMPEMRMNIG